MGGHSHQKAQGEGHCTGVYHEDILGVQHFLRNDRRLTGAGQLRGEENTHYLIPFVQGGLKNLGEYIGVDLGCSREGGSPSQTGIKFGIGDVDAVPESLLPEVDGEGKHLHPQLLSLGGREITGTVCYDLNHGKAPFLRIQYVYRCCF